MVVSIYGASISQLSFIFLLTDPCTSSDTHCCVFSYIYVAISSCMYDPTSQHKSHPVIFCKLHVARATPQSPY